MKPTLRVALISAISLALGGCASLVNALKEPGYSSDKLDEPGELNKLKGYAGDTRLVRTTAVQVRDDGYRGDDPRKQQTYFRYEVCAEARADALILHNAGSSLSLVGKGSGSDATTQGAQVTNVRGAISDSLQHVAWHLCNARMNKWMTNEQYVNAILKLQNDTFVVLQQAALGKGATLISLQSAINATTAPGTAAQSLQTVISALPVAPTVASDPAKDEDKKEEDEEEEEEEEDK